MVGNAYEFEIRGLTPLLMHADSIEGADIIKEWRDNPQNKGLQRPGDDRSPAWGWMYSLYLDAKQEKICMPAVNVTTALMKAGSYLSAGKGKTLKRSAAAGLMIPDEYLPFQANGKSVSFADLSGNKLPQEVDPRSFEKLKAVAAKHHIMLWSKRAKIGQAKHIRVRPRFESWSVSGRIEILLPEFTADVVKQLFEIAGRRVGLGDWRPDSPKSPGPFGQFETKIKAAK